MKLNPGQLPNTKAEALESVLQTQQRLALVMDIYEARAEMANHDVQDALQADESEVSEEVLRMVERAVGDRRTIQLGALVELLVDLNHYCVENNLRMSQATQLAEAAFGTQVRTLGRRIMYQVPDEPAADDSTSVYVLGEE